MSYDVITFGSATRDVFLNSNAIHIIKDPEFTTGAAECVGLGTKVEADNLFFDTGGGATNAAATFARLGHKTAVVTRIGHDQSGDMVRVVLRQEGIAADFVQTTKDDHTAYSVLLSAGTADKTAIVYRGASKKIEHAKVPWKKLVAKWFYVTSLGGDLALFRKILTAARQCGAKIAWNPGGGELSAGLDRLNSFIGATDVFMVNREEAAGLAGVSFAKLNPILRALQRIKHQVIVVTDGRAGADALVGSSLVHVGALDVPRVNTTGAGDAFGSGFVAGFMHRGSVDEALRVAIVNSNSVVQHLGAKPGIIRKYPSPAQLRKVPTTPILASGRHEH